MTETGRTPSPEAAEAQEVFSGEPPGPVSITVDDWDGLEWRFSSEELAAIELLAGTEAGGLCGVRSRLPDEVCAAATTALVARGVLGPVERDHGRLGPRGLAGLVLTEALVAPVRFAVSTVGRDFVDRVVWHVNPVASVRQRHESDGVELMAFRRLTTAQTFEDMALLCGLGSSDVEVEVMEGVEAMAVAKALFDSAGATVGASSGMGRFESILLAAPELGGAQPGSFEEWRMTQWCDLTWATADGPFRLQLRWLFDDQGRYWVDGDTTPGWPSGPRLLTRVGGTQILRMLQDLLPRDSSEAVNEAPA